MYLSRVLVFGIMTESAAGRPCCTVTVTVPVMVSSLLNAGTKGVGDDATQTIKVMSTGEEHELSKKLVFNANPGRPNQTLAY